MTAEDRGPRVILDQVGDWSLPLELLEEGVRTVLEAHGTGDGEISLTYMDDEGISALNQEHLGRDGPTDVIAFALHEAQEPVLGDVYVGYEQALRQSSELGLPLGEELLRLAIHGTLHVLGFQHPEGEDRFESPMFTRQEELLAEILARAGR